MPRTTLTPEETEQRKRAIVQARRAREPFDSIGATHGITPQRANQIYWAALKEIPNQDVVQHRAEEAELIDRATSALLAIAEDPDVHARSRIEAWSAVRGWCEHKARLLGLNAPVRREITVLSESVVDQALAEVAAQHEAKVRELEALEARAIAGAKEALAEMETTS